MKFWLLAYETKKIIISVILSLRMLLLAQPMQTALCGLAIMCGIVAFAYYAKSGCDPFKAGYISNLNQVSLTV